MAGKTNNIDTIISISQLDTPVHVYVGLRLLFVALFLSILSIFAGIYGRMKINTTQQPQIRRASLSLLSLSSGRKCYYDNAYVSDSKILILES